MSALILTDLLLKRDEQTDATIAEEEDMDFDQGGGGWAPFEVKLHREFIPLAGSYFREIRDRITRTVLLMFQEHVIGPL